MRCPPHGVSQCIIALVCCCLAGMVLPCARAAASSSDQVSPDSQVERLGTAGVDSNSLGQPPPWVRDNTWQMSKQRLANLPFAPSVLELCAGAGTASLALKLLLGPDRVRLAGAWDLDPELQGIHKVVHGPGQQQAVHLGKRAGDILTTDLANFPSANILVAGPPCPPFSSCGKRRLWEDPRGRPFERCVEVITELDSRCPMVGVDGQPGHRDELMFFLLENVAGITHVPSGAVQSPLDTLLLDMRRQLRPAGWLVQYVTANALHYGLPQNRPRIYILGRKVKFYTQYIPRGAPRFHSQVRAAELLDTSDNEPAAITALQEQCLAEWKGQYRTAMNTASCLGQYAFVEGGRDPTGRTTWASRKSTQPPHVDRCQCLRASGPMMHVFALGEGGLQLSLDRLLRVRERAALQGFPDSIGHLPFSEDAGRRIFGNAMTVSVVGAIMATELEAIQATFQGTSATPHKAKPVAPPAPEATATPLVDSTGPLSSLLPEDVENLGDDSDIMPGQRAAVVRWAANIRAHWLTGQPGRAPKPDSPLEPEDHVALAKRRREARSRESSRLPPDWDPRPSCNLDNRDSPEEPILAGSFGDTNTLATAAAIPGQSDAELSIVDTQTASGPGLQFVGQVAAPCTNSPPYSLDSPDSPTSPEMVMDGFN